ncbi:MAG: hypothetical protein NDI88_15405 [Lysobacter sp.]|nr:hypothetical protein [Lysobacter sp.]
MRRLAIAAAVLFAMLVPLRAASSTTWGIDMTDLWWNPGESGWGANISHQQDVIFLTLFVYGADGKARWYVAPAMVSGLASQGADHQYTFAGELIEASGPPLGDAFDAQGVARRVVGTATLQFSQAEAATLSYSVDGTAVTRAITRQTFRQDDLSGAYAGTVMSRPYSSGCATLAGGGGATEFSITHSGSSIRIAATIGTRACEITGAYTQAGKMAQVNGLVACENGLRGLFRAWEVEGNYRGFMASYFADFGAGCMEAGRMGGMRRY